MTQMYPFVLNSNSKSSAEWRLYDAFARELNDDWLVFHHVKWIGKDDPGRPRDGEADFVVAHPHLGVLVIKVKRRSGHAGCDGSLFQGRGTHSLYPR